MKGVIDMQDIFAGEELGNAIRRPYDCGECPPRSCTVYASRDLKPQRCTVDERIPEWIPRQEEEAEETSP